MYYTTKLSPSVLLPVSLRWTTMRGHNPTMLLTTSTSDDIDSSPVMMARRRLERDIIQSRCSAPFRRLQNKFHHREGIQRSEDGKGDLLQTSLQETQIKDGIPHQLARVPTSQILPVRVGQHMRPARNSNKGRRTTHCRHNSPEH